MMDEAAWKAFLRRRTRPLLNRVGRELPLSFLLEEAYLQGMRDTVQTMERPRWIADRASMILTERQQDNSYKDAYQMIPLKR